MAKTRASKGRPPAGTSRSSAVAKKAARSRAAAAPAKTRSVKAAPAKAVPAKARPETLAALRAALKAANARIAALEKHAHVDVLLDILNRRGFERELKRAIAYVKRYQVSAALLYGDVDGLKPINDAFGHGVGDRYLKVVARALADHVRLSDTLARLGGDEFALLLWNISEADAKTKAASLEEMVDALDVVVGRRRVRGGLSIGWTMITPLDQAGRALARADRAMYARKRQRKAASSSP